MQKNTRPAQPESGWDDLYNMYEDEPDESAFWDLVIARQVADEDSLDEPSRPARELIGQLSAETFDVDLKPAWVAARNRYLKTKPQAVPGATRLNDALVIGNLDAPEAQTVLASEITALRADTMREPGNKWKLITATVRHLVQHQLSTHPVSESKDGATINYARSARGRKHTSSGKATQYGFRIQSKIDAVTAFFVDVDGTDKARRVADRIAELGLFGVVYTTHSHAAKKTEHGDRFRVVIFLEQPFEFPTDDPVARREAVAAYHARYAGMCELLGLDDIDSSAMALNQMMHLPRRASEDAEFEHYIIAGRALRIEEMPESDASKYRKTRTPVSRGEDVETSAKSNGEPPVLSDGFDVLDWWNDGGRFILLLDLLDYLGWPDLGGAGDGRAILCPNDAAHSNPGDPDDRGTWAVEGEKGCLIYCHHDHCRPGGGGGLRTWDMIRLLEQHILDGVIALPDGYSSLSHLLCAPFLYPEIEGEDLIFDPADYGVVEEIEIRRLSNAKQVARAFDKVAENDNAGADHYAALYAGVEKAGSTNKAVQKLKELMKAHGGFKGNDLTSLAKRGKDMLKAERAAYAAEQADERRREAEEALDREDLANLSLDPAEPLGDDLKSSLATLRYRYAIVDAGGKFRVVRKPDLTAFNSAFDSTIVYYTKQDFIDLHQDRRLPGKEGEMIDPAKEFLGVEKRKSGVVFAPPPQVPGANDFNMYQGRKLKSNPGQFGDERDFPVLHDFMLNVACDGNEDKYKWAELWMADMVQHPGLKPGTAIIATGSGGVGKGTFGAILMRLAAPHCKQLENEAHVIGQFAGDHLSKCILVVVNEAVFGASPRVSSTLKSHVDSTSIQAEAKGLEVVTVPSYMRFYFDSNDAVPVLIENNGSERRYFVLRFSDVRKQNLAYFAKVREAIEGDEMAALLSYLEGYDPASAGLTWDAVRTAPETPERVTMGEHSMRAPMRRLKEVMEEGEVTLPGPDGLETYTGGPAGLKVPLALFREHIAAAGDKRRAEDADVEGMFKRLFPDAALGKGQGKVGGHDNKRWLCFPADVIGQC